LLDVRHPQDMRGPRCRLGAYGAVSSTSPRFMTKSPFLTCGFGARGGIRTLDLPITRRMLGVGLDGSRRIWAAYVGRLVGPDGSRRIQKDRLDDHWDDQGASDTKSDGKASNSRPATPSAWPRSNPPLSQVADLCPSLGISGRLKGRSGGCPPGPSIPAPCRPGGRRGTGRCRCWAAMGAAGRQGLTVRAAA
jgi:hypothetical protein